MTGHRKNSTFASRTKRKFPGAAEIGPLIANTAISNLSPGDTAPIGQHDAVGHVEALDRPRARPAGGARHRAVDPDFRVVVDVDAEHRLGAGGVEARDVRGDRQGGTEPDERHQAAAEPDTEIGGRNHGPIRVVEAEQLGMGFDVVGRLELGQRVGQRGTLDDLRFLHPPPRAERRRSRLRHQVDDVHRRDRRREGRLRLEHCRDRGRDPHRGADVLARGHRDQAGRFALRNVRTCRTASGIFSFVSFHGKKVSSDFGASIADSMAGS